MLLAFVFGGLAARAINLYFISGGFQELTGTYSLQEFFTIFGLGAVAILWLDTKGHYRQRLPYWEIVGHIVAVALVGFVFGGFVQFAVKNAPSRLWLGLSWSTFGVFLLVGRSLTRQLLDKKGLWQVPAVILGTGPTAQAARAAIVREREMGFTIVQQVPADRDQRIEAPARLETLSECRRRPLCVSRP